MKVDFTLFEAGVTNEILPIILSERRKELIMRGVRFMDLKRLNTVRQTSTIIRRTIGAVDYVLEPNSPRYALAIPQVIIALSGMAQNER